MARHHVELRMLNLTKVIMTIVLVALGARAAFPQVVTGNLPATKDEIKKLGVYEASPTASGEAAPPSQVDNSTHLVVAHQKFQGACSAFAVSYAISMLASI